MLQGKSQGSTLFDSDFFIISNFEWNELSLCESPSVYFGLLNDKSLILITSQVQVYLTQLEAFLYILEVKDFKQTMFSRTCVRNILLSADFFQYDNMSSLITLVPHMVSVAYPRFPFYFNIWSFLFSIDSSSNSAVTVEIGNFGFVLKISWL